MTKLRELKKQPIRFLATADSAEALIMLDRPLTRCLEQHSRRQGSEPELSEAAEAFIERCTKSLVALRSYSIISGCPFEIEIMLTDSDGPPREVMLYLFLDSYDFNLSFEPYSVTLLRKEPATGIHGEVWQGMQHLVGQAFHQKRRVHFADGPDAERWREDWEEKTGSLEAPNV